MVGNTLRLDGVSPGADDTVAAVDAAQETCHAFAAVGYACSLLEFGGEGDGGPDGGVGGWGGER